MSENKECWATFHGKGGYSYQNKEANQLLTVGEKYKIIGGELGRSSTSLVFEGIPGFWNSVMFDFDQETAPLEPTYLGVRLPVTKSYPAELDGNSYYTEPPQPVVSSAEKFIAYAESQGWNTVFAAELGGVEITFLNRGVQSSWELWQEARKA